MAKIFSVVAIVVLLMLVGCEESEPKSLFIDAPESADFGSIRVEPSSPQYDEIKTFLEEVEVTQENGIYRPSDSEYAEIQSIMPTLTPEMKRKAELWREQFVHWENVDALVASKQAIMENKVVDGAEFAFTCEVLPQWVEQMTAAREYVEEYRKAEPEKVASEPNLLRLDEVTKQNLDALSSMERDCISAGRLPSSQSLSTPAPTPTRYRAEIKPGMTEEEIEAELLKDPCYKGKGQLGHIWDTECLMHGE